MGVSVNYSVCIKYLFRILCQISKVYLNIFIKIKTEKKERVPGMMGCIMDRFTGGTQWAGGGGKRWCMCLGGYVIEWVCGVG